MWRWKCFGTLGWDQESGVLNFQERNPHNSISFRALKQVSLLWYLWFIIPFSFPFQTVKAKRRSCNHVTLSWHFLSWDHVDGKDCTAHVQMDLTQSREGSGERLLPTSQGVPLQWALPEHGGHAVRSAQVHALRTKYGEIASSPGRRAGGETPDIHSPCFNGHLHL